MSTTKAPGDAIREHRKRVQLSQAQAATLAGVSISTFALAERFGASERVARLLAPVLQCSPEEITNNNHEGRNEP
jgi:DNA-binding XRE family transcriptional regulator